MYTILHNLENFGAVRVVMRFGTRLITWITPCVRASMENDHGAAAVENIDGLSDVRHGDRSAETSPSPVSELEETQSMTENMIAISRIRAIGVDVCRSRIHVGFYIAVQFGGLEWRTSIKPAMVDTDIVEWDDAIVLPSNVSSGVSFEMRASFEFNPMLGNGELVRRFEIASVELLQRNTRARPVTFFADDKEFMSTCSSLVITARHRKPQSSTAVFDSHLSDLELHRATDIGHEFLRHFRRHEGKTELERAVERFEFALSICPPDHPCRAAALFNLASTKDLECEINGTSHDFDLLISLYRDALALRPIGHPDRPTTLINLSSALWSRFQHSRRAGDTDEASELLRQALDLSSVRSFEHETALLTYELQLLSKGIDHRPARKSSIAEAPQDDDTNLADLGMRYLKQFQRFGDTTDLDLAITFLEDSKLSLAPRGERYPEILHTYGVSLLERFERLGNVTDLERAISTLEDCVQFIPKDHPHHASSLNDLSSSFRSRFERFGELGDLDRAITRQEDAVRLTPEDHPQRAARLHNLGSHFHGRFLRLGESSDLDRAIERLEAAAQLSPDDHPARASFQGTLGTSLRSRFESFGRTEDLDRAIATQEDAVRLTPSDHPDLALRMNNLALSFSARFNRFGDLRDIDRAITNMEATVRLIPNDHPDRSHCLNNLGSCFSARFNRLGDLDDLDQAIARQEDALQLISSDHPDRPRLLNHISLSFITRFRRLGRLDDLNRAVAKVGDAVRLTPNGHPDRAPRLNNLGLRFHDRFIRLGDLDDLDQAIVRLEDALRLTPEDHPSRSHFLSNLGSCFSARFDRLGELGDLDQAIARQEDSLQLIPHDHPDRALLLNHLSMSLITRFRRLGDLGDLSRAIAKGENAVRLTPEDHPQRAPHLNSLGLHLHGRFNRLGDLGDLNTAILRLEDALRLTPEDHPDRAFYLSSLGLSLRTRFTRLGDLDNLHRAIALMEDAIQRTPEDHPHRARYLHTLGLSLKTRFDNLGDIGDLNRAIAKQEDALRFTSDDDPAHAVYLTNLALYLTIHFVRLRNRPSLESALVKFTCAANSSAATPSCRLSASNGWILCSHLLGDESELFAAYSLAVQILPQLAWIGLPFPDRYKALLRFGRMGVAREAASAALELGHPSKAAEWLEQGRSVVWSQLLHLRTPIDELRTEHPALADRLFRVSNALEHASMLSDHSVGLQAPLQSTEEQSRLHRSLALEREKLLEKVRSLRGFDRFLLGKSINQLTLAAHSGPVVIVNAGKTRCDALIIAGDSDVRHVPLPDITLAQAIELGKMLDHALEGSRLVLQHEAPQEPVSDAPSTRAEQRLDVLDHFLDDIGRELSPANRAARLAEKLDPSEAFHVILSTLWMHVVKPVLDALQFSTTGELRRIFWCPTGPFAFLPIHAAGLYNTTEDGSKLSDFVISSYTPTLSALVPTPALNEPDHVRLLAVGQPMSDGQSYLPGARTELEHIESTVHSLSTRHVSVIRSNATVEDVLEKIKESEWVHFACHGVQDRQNPVDSGLQLADGRRLKLSDIIKLSRPPGGLAFLSACQTATGDSQLSEEAVHLAAAMLFAGYSSVIATMWSIADSDAPQVSKDVYEQLFKEGEVPKSRLSAAALHHAVQRLREQGRPFVSWVPFIHVGL